MWKLMTACCAAFLVASTAAQAEEPHFAAFEVSRSSPVRSHDIAALDFGGATVSFAAYGRKARAGERL